MEGSRADGEADVAKARGRIAGGAFATLLALAVSILGPALPAAAQQASEPSLEVAAADRQLVMEGTVGNDAASFSRNVAVRATGGAASEVVLRAKDLVAEGDPPAIIDRSNISITPGIALKDAEYRDVRVTVSGIERPGVYEGSITFWVSAENQVRARETDPVRVVVRALPAPEVSPVQATGSAMKLVRSPSSELLADANGFLDWTLPRGLADREKVVRFTNRTPGDVRVIDAELFMQGQGTGRVLAPGGAFDIRAAEVFPERETTENASEVILEFRRKEIQPDRYVGALEVDLERADDPVVANLTLDVRDPPFWPLLLVLAGVGLGRLAGWVLSPEAIERNALRRRLERLRGRVRARPDEEESWLIKQMDDAGRALRDRSRTNAALGESLRKIEADVDFLEGVEFLERRAERVGVLTQARPDLDGARAALLNDDPKEANTCFKSARAKVLAATFQAAGNAAGVHPGDVEAAAASEELRDLPNLPNIGVRAQADPDPPPFWEKFWGWFWRTVRWALYVVLLVLLGILGWVTLYVNNGAAFGSGGLLDYLGLVLWGLSADVVGRTLSNLPGLARPAAG